MHLSHSFKPLASFQMTAQPFKSFSIAREPTTLSQGVAQMYRWEQGLPVSVPSLTQPNVDITGNQQRCRLGNLGWTRSDGCRGCSRYL